MVTEFAGSSFRLVSKLKKMVHDRLQGVEMDGRSDPKQGRHDPVSVAEEDVLSSLAARAPKEHQIENTQRIAGFAIGTASMLAAQCIAHPLSVFRRQCQVNHSATRYHISPFSVFQIIIRLERNQGCSPLWKGFGSTYIVCAVNLFSEAAISNLTQLPQEKPDKNSTYKDVASHLLLKSLSLIASMPIAAASLAETVQSERIKDQKGALESFKDNMYRLVGWNRSSLGRHCRLLPVWSIVLPTVLHGLVKYILETVFQHLVLLYLRNAGLYKENTLREKKDDEPEPHRDLVQSYFPELTANFVGFVVPEIVVYPMETVLHRLYVQGTRTIIDDLDNGYDVVPLCTNYDGMLDCFRTIWREEGLGGFYKGFGALLLQIVVHFLILKLTKFVYVQLSEDFKGKPTR